MMKNDFGLFLSRCCQAAPSADNSQPCSLEWQSPVLTLRYDAERVGAYTFPFDSQATLLSAGAALENILCCCEFAGVEAGVATFPEGESSHVYAQITLTGFESVVNFDFPDSVFARHTNRFSYKKEALPQSVVDKVEGFSHQSGVGVKVLTNRRHIADIAEQIQLASEVRFQTQEVHEWLEKSLRFTPQEVEGGDGLDIDTLALPPGGGLFLRLISSWPRMEKLNRIGGYKMLAAIDAAPVRKAPAVVAVTAPATLFGALEAGQIMCRAWSYLNSQGLACHPYYVISDQLERLVQNKVPAGLVGQAEEVRKKCRQLLDLNDGETLVMLLRVGYPTREAPRSRRLPLERVFTDLS